LNEATTKAVLAVVEMAREHLAAHDNSIAIALVEDCAYVGNYWNDPAGFEAEVAAMIEGADRVVFGVPIVMRVAANSLASFRAVDGVVGDDENEQLFLLSLDLADGMDVLRCCIQRTDGLALSDDVEIYQGELQLDKRAPGFRVLQALLPQEDGS
jgi:hypothetical protein